jgi:hypothetical protein
MALEGSTPDKDREMCRKYIPGMVISWEQTGYLRERYNAVAGSQEGQFERQPSLLFARLASRSADIFPVNRLL